MERLIITPTDEKHWLELRTKDLTSTDMAALFGISPYLTPFELWHRKKSGEVVSIDQNERMEWGTLLEEAIATGAAKKHGWNIRPMKEYIRIPDQRIGASFDYWIEGSESILEIKNVDSLAYKQGWIVEGNHVEAPPHIELQVQHQLHVKDAEHSIIAALVGGNRLVLIERSRDEKIIKAIETRAMYFWETIDKNIEPKPDFAKDADFIKSLYAYAAPGKVIDSTGDGRLLDLTIAYKEFSAQAKKANEDKDAVKAEILTLIGDAEKVVCDRYSISAGLVGPKHVEYEARGYRDFRIFEKKVKNEAIA